jgi:hypothetical protein
VGCVFGLLAVEVWLEFGEFGGLEVVAVAKLPLLKSLDLKNPEWRFCDFTEKYNFIGVIIIVPKYVYSILLIAGKIPNDPIFCCV